MKYLVIIFGIIIVVLLVIIIFVPAKKSSPATPSNVTENAKSDKDLAIEKAKTLYEEKKREGVDFANGPCLSEEVTPDWAVDMAHNPRIEVDNRAENQCQSFRAGKTHHFVELDTAGNFIRAL